VHKLVVVSYIKTDQLTCTFMYDKATCCCYSHSDSLVLVLTNCTNPKAFELRFPIISPALWRSIARKIHFVFLTKYSWRPLSNYVSFEIGTWNLAGRCPLLEWTFGLPFKIYYNLAMIVNLWNCGSQKHSRNCDNFIVNFILFKG